MQKKIIQHQNGQKLMSKHSSCEIDFLNFLTRHKNNIVSYFFHAKQALGQLGFSRKTHDMHAQSSEH